MTVSWQPIISARSSPVLLGSWCIGVHLWASSRRVDQAIGVLGILSRLVGNASPRLSTGPSLDGSQLEPLEPPLTLPRFLQVFGTMALQRGGNGQPHGCTYRLVFRRGPRPGSGPERFFWMTILQHMEKSGIRFWKELLLKKSSKARLYYTEGGQFLT